MSGDLGQTHTLSCTWVLWSGATGGTELMVAALAGEFRRRGADARVLFVGDGAPLTARLDLWGVPWSSLDLPRSRRAFFSGGRFSDVLSQWGSAAVVLPSVDALAWSLRRGGFGGTIIAVDHGSPTDQRRLGTFRQQLRRLSRRLGVSSIDVQVTVSESVNEQALELPHARVVKVIHNGVDTARFVPGPERDRSDGALRLGLAARLVEGKGVRESVEAVAALRARGVSVRLEIAGVGPLSAWLQAHPAVRTGDVALLGHVDDVPAFWRSQQCGLALTFGLTETFGLSAVEAMATGLPVVASRAGGLAEVVEDGVTGVLIEPGDIEAAAAAVARYADDRALMARHGDAGRALAVRRFSLDRCADEYLALCGGPS